MSLSAEVSRRLNGLSPTLPECHIDRARGASTATIAHSKEVLKIYKLVEKYHSETTLGELQSHIFAVVDVDYRPRSPAAGTSRPRRQQICRPLTVQNRYTAASIGKICLKKQAYMRYNIL